MQDWTVALSSGKVNHLYIENNSVNQRVLGFEDSRAKIRTTATNSINDQMFVYLFFYYGRENGRI